MVGLAGQVVVLLANHGNGEAWTFVLASGPLSGPVTTASAVAYDEPVVYEYQLAQLGDQAVLAWIGARYPGRIGLALLNP